LTYMSIQDKIDSLCVDRRLFRVRPSWPGLQEVRVIYVTPGIIVLLEGPWADRQTEKRWNRARQQIDDFIDGKRLTLRTAPRKKSTCFMSQLDPPDNEIWEIRCRDPKPGLRIFGSFATLNVFVGLTWDYHEDLGPEEDWKRAIRNYQAQWQMHFTAPAFTGSYPHGYLTKAVILD
jgi:hypothetical protein